MYKQLIKIAALGLATVAVLPVMGHAQVRTETKMMVTARGGLNLRDKDCKLISTYRYGTPLTAFNNPMNCTINGQSTKMVEVSVYNRSGYMAESFLAAWGSASMTPSTSSTAMTNRMANFASKDMYTVNTRSGLWLRTTDLRLSTKVPMGTVLQNPTKCGGAVATTMETVNVRGQRWSVIPVCYNGKLMKTADALLK